MFDQKYPIGFAIRDKHSCIWVVTDSYPGTFEQLYRLHQDGDLKANYRGWSQSDMDELLSHEIVEEVAMSRFPGIPMAAVEELQDALKKFASAAWTLNNACDPFDSDQLNELIDSPSLQFAINCSLDEFAAEASGWAEDMTERYYANA